MTVQSKRIASEDSDLTEALKATFPASDPPAVVAGTSATEPDRPLHRRPALLDAALVRELAAKAEAKQLE